MRLEEPLTEVLPPNQENISAGQKYSEETDKRIYRGRTKDLNVMSEFTHVTDLGETQCYKEEDNCFEHIMGKVIS